VRVEALGIHKSADRQHLGDSVVAVNTLYSKAMAKLRRLLK
jgi:hypothetical protein